MKIAFTGDFHFGFSNDAAVQAQRALLDAASNADVIVCGGDLFDTRIPRQETLDEALNIFSKTKSAMKYGNVGIFEQTGGKQEPISGFSPIIAIHGTHERRSRGLVNPVQLLDSAKAFINIHGRKIVIEKGGERVCFQGLGGVPEEFARIALKKMDFQPMNGAFNVFVFHQSFEEAIAYGGDTLSAADLPSGFDLYIDGHIHWAQDIDADGKRILLPGSTVVTQMRKKEAAPKIYLLFDTTTGKCESVEIKTRPFVFLEADAGNAASPSDAISKAHAELSKIDIAKFAEKPLVKLKVIGTLAKGFSSSDVDLSPLLKEFSSGMLLYIDRDIESADLSKNIAATRQAQSEAKSVRELTISLLLEALKKRGIDYDSAELESLFDALSDSDLSTAASLL